MADSYSSFWLVPQAPDLNDFQDIINTLAVRFDTVPFCPHVTLYSGLVASTLDVQAVLAELSSTRSLELEISGLHYESHFAKTLYIQLKQSPMLSKLVYRLVEAIPQAQVPALNPHVSLLYNNLDNATQQALTQKILLSRPTIQFDQVQVIAAPQTFETQEHVASLRCVHSQLLTTP